MKQLIRRVVVVLVGVTSALGLAASTASLAQATTPALTATTVTSSVAGSTTTLSGITVTGFDDSNTGTPILLATVSTTLGSLSMSQTSGLTLSYGYSSFTGSTFSFTGTQAHVDAGLATLALNSSSIGTAAVSFNVLADSPAGIAYLPANGHFYEYEANTNVTWTAANTDAQALNFNGQQGYLASAATSSINTLIANNVQGAQNVWIGGEAEDYPSGYSCVGDPYYSNCTSGSTAVDRIWAWSGGPLVGQIFTECTSAYMSCVHVSDSADYSDWNSGEPNDSGASSSMTLGNGSSNVGERTYPSGGDGEWVIETNLNGSPGIWNDLNPTNSTGIDGYVVEFGGQTNTNVGGTGFSNVYSETNNVSVVSVPGVPLTPTATSGNASAAVSWSAPASNGNSAITGYTVTSSPGGLTCTSATTSCTVSGLTNGTSYTFSVTATNSVGTGAASASTSATVPATVPGVPLSPTATRGNANALVSWTAPASTGGASITGYTVTSSPGGLTCTSATTSCTVSGLTNGTSYTFSVTATNSVGTGAASAATGAVVPATVPGAPLTPSATSGNDSVVVSWSAPTSSGGLSITGYTVTSSPGGLTCTSATTSCTVSGLTNGTSYTFSVTATTGAGTGAASSATSAVVPATIPGVPLTPTATSGNGSAAVSWSAPASTGGSSITGYTVTASPGGLTCTSATTSCTVSGLTNGTSYTFSVTATNIVGTGAVSAATSAVIPATLPGVPLTPTASRGNTSAAVSWTAPTSNGGSAITAYLVTSSPGGLTCTTATTSCTVSGLTNGTSYTFSVTATNIVGTGAASAATSAIVPADVPGAPTSVGGVSGNGQALISWTAPTSTGGASITGYTVTSNPGGLTCVTTTNACTVVGLSNGTSYTFTVAATNIVGAGVQSASTGAIVPATVPGAPTAVSVTSGNESVVASWSAPASSGGLPVTSYTVTASPSGASCTAVTTTCTVSGLTNGVSYTFAVTATNTVGTGSPSASSTTVTPATAPGVPTLQGDTVGAGSATISWSPPASNGGSPITGYVVTANPGGATCTTTTTSCVVGGLTDGASYTFTVIATNAAGSSASSTQTPGITPVSVPGLPTGVSAAPGIGQTTVSWSQPTSSGGAPITSYVVTASPGGQTCTTSGYSCVVPGLTNGTNYVFTVTAVNSVGAGSAVDTSGVMPMSVPAPPVTTHVDLGTTQATVHWSPAPAVAGTPAITYTVTASPGGQTCESTTNSCTVTGLVPGATYRFSVKASDSFGTSSSATSGPASGGAQLTPVRTPLPVAIAPAVVPVRVRCRYTTCSGRAVATVARWVGGATTGHWRHIVLASARFEVKGGRSVLLHLHTTHEGRVILGSQLSRWTMKTGHYRMTLTVHLHGRAANSKPVFLRSV